MKAISVGLSNHLDGEVTTLATCWKIVRRDGAQFFFTDHDQDITIGLETYEAESSYSRTAVASGSDFSVDNLDVAGVVDSEKISNEELRSGLFNRADVYIFVVNWADPTQGILKVRRGWFGEVSLSNDGQFHTEIRGLAQALSHNYIEIYTAECRADFCDTRCKLNLADFINYGVVTSVTDRETFIAAELPDAPSTGTSVGAHRVWSIAPYAWPDVDFGAIAEIRFFDQDDHEVTGGVTTDTLELKNSKKEKHVIEGHKSKYARDGKMGTSWAAMVIPDVIDNIDDFRWIITFPTAVDIKTVEIISTEKANETPTAFVLQYSDNLTLTDPGYAWTTAKDCSYAWATPGQSAIWGIGSDTDAPINISEDPIDLPPPYMTVSTYVGGTVEWTSGRNRGRVVEILGYNDGTNAITMFEAMPYAVKTGDTFKIAQGCDKSLARCKIYNNVVNRRAEDYVPGNDNLMAYPDAK